MSLIKENEKVCESVCIKCIENVLCVKNIELHLYLLHNAYYKTYNTDSKKIHSICIELVRAAYSRSCVYTVQNHMSNDEL